MNILSRKQIFWLGLVLIVAGSVWYLSVCMKISPWGFSDSATYFSVARNIAKGIGLGTLKPDGTFVPLQWHPPFYSIVLSFFALLGFDLIDAARILNILLSSFLIITCGSLFYYISESWLLGLFFALMIATTPSLARVYTSLMSEPLSISLGLPGFLLLLFAVKRNSTILLILAALCTGLSSLTRYAFIAMPISGVLVILLLSRKIWKQRLIQVFVYSIVSFSPITFWLIAQLLTRTNVGGRHYEYEFSFVTKAFGFINAVYNVLKYWFPYRSNMIPGLPSDFVRPVLGIFFSMVVIIGFVLSIRFMKMEKQLYSAVLLISGFAILVTVYLLVLFMSYAIVIETIDIDNRMLSPLSIMFYAILLAGSLSISKKLHHCIPIPLAGLVISLFFIMYGYHPLRSYLLTFSNYPDGYASIEWKNSRIFDEVQKLPEGIPVISNAVDILLFHTNRSAYILTSSAYSGDTTVTLNDKERIAELMSSKCGAVVLFDPDKAMAYNPRPQPPTESDIQTLRSMFVSVYQGIDGEILRDPKCVK